MDATVNGWIFIIVTNMYCLGISTGSCYSKDIIALTAQAPGVDATMAPEQKSTEDRLSEEVKDAVKDSFRIRSDNVAALADTPCDGIQKPQKDGQNPRYEVHFGNIGPERSCMFARSPCQGPCDDKESTAAKDEVAPLQRFRLQYRQLGLQVSYLVGGSYKGTNQSGDDHDLVNDKRVENGWPWQTRCKQQIQEQEWGCNDPRNVNQAMIDGTCRAYQSI